MISIKNISKSFGQKVVLNNVTSTFEKGKVNLIIGKSGSGKTVAIKCMLGLFNIDSGGIFFDDRDFINIKESDRKEIRKEIGMVFQGGALFDSMTVEENIMFPLKMSSRINQLDMVKRVNFCLNRVNLQGVNNLYPSELSGGMQKRVAIARAIALKPKYLFCDEPNSGLDPNTANVIDNLLKEITYEYNITTVINTHDMNSVMEIGDNIVFIEKGVKEWSGTRKNFLNSNNKILNRFIFSSKLFRKLKSVK
ncbi:MAG: ABC transporter ATP-binding protein [Flavobacteriales bacterium]|jgi:phospholipid/cholesterol/gamma-HCH transport system ATP-binding protein|nr:ABC transporter ATP-binding protein [Flavobacteriales bacterium]|tara:strand:+ start:912 stop:1664 length:753 start_codon:yes stop_codon:yes gene_type:complete